MAKIVILGSGVMGTAIALPPAQNGHEVILAGSPLDDALIDAMAGLDRAHPKLGVTMPGTITLVKDAAISDTHFSAADIVLLGVSTPGLPWVLDCISRHVQTRPTLMMVTKGLEASPAGQTRTLPHMINETMQDRLGFNLPIVGVGGPCIAREVAQGQPTATVFGSTEMEVAKACQTIFQRPDYQVRTTTDLDGLEACAAIKNFMAIGVAASWGANPPHNPTEAKSRSMNPAAGSFQQAVTEMAKLCVWLGGQAETAYQLPGLGDLFVTVNAGRNSRLGFELGRGLTVSQAMSGKLAGETVEGVDTGRNLAVGLEAAFADGHLDPSEFPLTRALVTALIGDTLYQIDIRSYW